MQNDNAISVLNNLIETCKDGELGFKTAADGLKRVDSKASSSSIRGSAARWCGSSRVKCAGSAGTPRRPEA